MTIDVYIEAGPKRSFAGAVEWPGWARSGRDEDAALASLVAYGPRYRAAVGSVGGGFKAPRDVAGLAVVERFGGSASTDMGTPGTAPALDARPLDGRELRRLRALLRACWDTFEAAAKKTEGRRLATGARGGGRDLRKMTAHVAEADQAYLYQLGSRAPRGVGVDVEGRETVRAMFLDALGARIRGELPERGPRGGIKWGARYAVRRAAWHALDHAWELEDRLA